MTAPAIAIIITMAALALGGCTPDKTSRSVNLKPSAFSQTIHPSATTSIAATMLPLNI
jgi:hypothetical protein